MPVSIHTALDRLDELAGASDRATLAALRDRLESTRLRVLVVGEAKRGKSIAGGTADEPHRLARSLPAGLGGVGASGAGAVGVLLLSRRQ